MCLVASCSGSSVATSLSMSHQCPPRDYQSPFNPLPLTLAAELKDRIVKKGGAKAHTKTNLLRQRKEIPKSTYMENHELHNPPLFLCPPHLPPPCSTKLSPQSTSHSFNQKINATMFCNLSVRFMACVLLHTTVCWSLQAWRNQCRWRDQIDWNDQVFILTGGSNGRGKGLGETLPSNT
ncbi:hypothetical protein PtA15_8A305 [Puccinia triticina]|uniref:Uncharacterized protein n=1 Tax=Puccinia triticina TaxID=208348 RepID=A0ABY7CTE3_9BASI|nr:uncharacterized protein PtA15_8A305 [Puccinia triticina]WAQ87401.1 hypothetical protein PtA15_8A305 [Puccinia triticina]